MDADATGCGRYVVVCAGALMAESSFRLERYRNRGISRALRKLRLFSAIAGGRSSWKRLKFFNNIQCCFGASQEKISMRGKQWRNLAKNFSLGLLIEVDQDIAHENDIDFGQKRPRLGEVQFTKLNHAPNFIPDLPRIALFGEVLDQKLGGKAAIHLYL